MSTNQPRTYYFLLYPLLLVLTACGAAGPAQGRLSTPARQTPDAAMSAAQPPVQVEHTPTTSRPPAEAVIRLNPAITYQTISGWEATAQAGQAECPNFNAYKDNLFDQAVNDLGINRLRVEVRSGFENPTDYFGEFLRGQRPIGDWLDHRYSLVNDNDDPQTTNPAGFQFSELDHTIETVVLPVKERLEARGETLFINVNYIDFATETDTHYGHPEEYAEFVLATYRHMQEKYGLTPDAWEVILEPDNSAWTGADIGQAIEATAARLLAAGFTPRFIAPSTTDMDNAWRYFDEMVGTAPGSLPYLAELSYHRYDGSQLAEIVRRAERYGLNTAMLEHIGSGYEDLHTDLTVGRNSAWQQFTLAYCETDNAAQYYWIDQSDPARPVARLGEMSRFLRQYFHFIRRDAVRIEAETANPAFDPVAFINPGGGFVVVVKAAEGGEFTIAGLPAGRYRTIWTTATQTNVAGPEVTLTNGQLMPVSIPEAGVVTVVQ